MNAELLVDEIFAVLDGEHDILDSSAMGLTEYEVYLDGGSGTTGSC